MTTFYRRRGKRLFDILGSSMALVLTLPIQALTAVFVLASLGLPIIFRQQRPGLAGNPFTLVKFRTMSNSVDTLGNLLPDNQRLGNLGGLLRSTSLDELPELWNVLKGDMSLVGPRPLLMDYLDHYTPEQHLRHTVRPGITGLAQVFGRNATTWDSRIMADSKYAQEFSLRLDIWILWKTIPVVLTRKGVHNPELPPFNSKTFEQENDDHK